MFYAVALEGLRKKALTCGYALAVHGTCASDMDLIAVCWSDTHGSPDELAESFIEELTQFRFSDEDFKGITNKERRYKNQLHYTIPIAGNWYVDLTVIDPE